MLSATFPYCLAKEDCISSPHYQEGVRENNAAMIEAAKTRGVPLFDMAEAMPTESRHWEDGRHVNESGARAMANLIAQFIDQSGLIGGAWKEKEEQD
ncbi:MAG: hypothetical protein NTW86_17825 [Candidatus Sumerlaeota bacterium]|nr:hypothetical protein [Candidatus Sumerlaeota bacterium]